MAELIPQEAIEQKIFLKSQIVISSRRKTETSLLFVLIRV